jgi:DNA-directed RNA polymerase specialized sigma24 family protein
LQRLGNSREEAGEEYELLRCKLIRFFSWERCPDPQSLADGCLDVLARKLGEGEEIRDLKAYVAAVARMVAKEEYARRRKEQPAGEAPLEFIAAPTPAGPELDLALAHLDRCLECFTPDQRRFILRYYEGDHASRINNRKKLAKELGMLPGALRNRALRLREILEACMSQRDGSANHTTKSWGAK